MNLFLSLKCLPVFHYTNVPQNEQYWPASVQNHDLWADLLFFFPSPHQKPHKLCNFVPGASTVRAKNVGTLGRWLGINKKGGIMWKICIPISGLLVETRPGSCCGGKWAKHRMAACLGAWAFLSFSIYSSVNAAQLYVSLEGGGHKIPSLLFFRHGHLLAKLLYLKRPIICGLPFIGTPCFALWGEGSEGIGVRKTIRGFSSFVLLLFPRVFFTRMGPFWGEP